MTAIPLRRLFAEYQVDVAEGQLIRVPPVE
jgi:hypothetical protein